MSVCLHVQLNFSRKSALGTCLSVCLGWEPCSGAAGWPGTARGTVTPASRGWGPQVARVGGGLGMLNALKSQCLI